MRKSEGWKLPRGNKSILMGIMCFSVLCLVSSCRLPQGERPFDYEPAKWISESGEFWFEVTEDTVATEENPFPVLEGGVTLDGEEYVCKVMFDGAVNMDIWEKEDWEYIRGHVEKERLEDFRRYVHSQNPVYEKKRERLLGGTCSFSPSKLVVRVSDKIGKYHPGIKIVFIRQPFEEDCLESEERK